MPAMLLVSDAEWVRNDVEAAVTHPDWTVDHVDDPRQVLDLALRGSYALFVMDLQVGSMGGMALTRQLADAMANEELDHAPVVLLLDRQADTFLAKRAGANAWLVKPFTAQALRRVMEELEPATPA